MRHLRAGQDRLALIGEAVDAFRRLAPADYGYFLATIEGDLGVRAAELGEGATPLLLPAPSASSTPVPTAREGSLREAVLGLLSDGRQRSTAEIRRELEASRPINPGSLHTEIFTLRKCGTLRSEGRGRGTRHALVPSSPPISSTTTRAGSTGKRESATRTPKRTRKRDDDEDHPRREGSASPVVEVELHAQKIYAAAIGAHYLLTKNEEWELSRRLEETETAIWEQLLAGPLGDEARLMLLELDTPIKPTSARQARNADLDRLVATRLIAEGAGRLEAAVRTAIRALCAEADRIRVRFATCNLRMVPATIRRHGYHRMTSLSMSDLIQEGNFGLLKAIPRFDHRRGLRFSTFATWWIRHYLVRARQNLGSEVRVPVHLQELAGKVRRTVVEFRRTHGRDPSQDEIASLLKVSTRSLQTLDSGWLKHRESLPVFDSVGEEGDLPSHLASDVALPDEVLAIVQEDDRLIAAVASMPRQLAQIVRRRFGLDGSEPEMLREIGDSMHLSRERVRQLEQKALAILREKLGDVLHVAA